jgi:DNA mismatch endonuclease (patch repair protein)
MPIDHKPDCKCFICRAKRHEPLSEETRKKLSLARIGNKNAKHSFQNHKFDCQCSFCKQKRGEGTAFKDRHHTTESREKMKLTHLGNKNALNHNVPDELKKKIGLRSVGNKYAFGYKATTESIKENRKRRLLQIFPNKDTKIEVTLQNKLKEKGITFKTHIALLGQPDIFIEPNTCVFADGCWIHACPIHNPNGGYKPLQGSDRRNHDKNITHKLEESGYVVLRFWGHEINDDSNSYIDKIAKEIS